METTNTQKTGHVTLIAFADDASYSASENTSAAKLFGDHYDLLKRIARAKRRTQSVGQTLQTTDLLHEVFAKLASRIAFADRKHFLSSAALAMRHVLTDHAKANMRLKRGSNQRAVSLDSIEDFIAETGSNPEEVITINQLLGDLSKLDPRLVRVVDCLYFGGYTMEETADLLDVSAKTVQRDWAKARGFLRERMEA